MLVNKKKRAPVIVEATGEIFRRMKPLNETDYPEYVDAYGRLYLRFYVRPRIIVYEVLYPVTKALDHYWVVPMGLKFMNFDSMVKYVDENDRNVKLKIVAK